MLNILCQQKDAWRGLFLFSMESAIPSAGAEFPAKDSALLMECHAYQVKHPRHSLISWSMVQICWSFLRFVSLCKNIYSRFTLDVFCFTRAFSLVGSFSALPMSPMIGNANKNIR